MKGQAALEYVVTYGWAFLVILVVIGGLAYFGVIRPSRWLPDECDFGGQLECVDYQLFEHGANLYLRNNFGKDINIGQVEYVTDTETLTMNLDIPIVTIPAGEAVELNLTCDNFLKGFAGEKREAIFKVTFRRKGSSNAHELVGRVYTVVKAG